MKTMSVGEFKTNFAQVLQQVKAGVGFAVTYGKRKKIIGYFLPESEVQRSKRQLGILSGKMKVDFKDDFKISPEELLG